MIRPTILPGPTKDLSPKHYAPLQSRATLTLAASFLFLISPLSLYQRMAIGWLILLDRTKASQASLGFYSILIALALFLAPLLLLICQTHASSLKRWLGSYTLTTLIQAIATPLSAAVLNLGTIESLAVVGIFFSIYRILHATRSPLRESGTSRVSRYSTLLITITLGAAWTVNLIGCLISLSSKAITH